MTEEQGLELLTRLDELSVKENFIPNVGPGMMQDRDDPAAMHLLERALSTLPNIEASAIIADESGIHWKTIHRTRGAGEVCGGAQPARAGNVQLHGDGDAEAAVGRFFPGRITPARASSLPLDLKARTWWPRCSRATREMPKLRQRT